jgi:hypothetical protein
LGPDLPRRRDGQSGTILAVNNFTQGGRTGIGVNREPSREDGLQGQQAEKPPDHRQAKDTHDRTHSLMARISAETLGLHKLCAKRVHNP